MNKEIYELILEHQDVVNEFMKITNEVFGDHKKAIKLLSERVDNLVDLVRGEEEELTGCCDASIVEQTGRCSKCLESV